MSTHAPLPVLHQGKPLMTPAKQPLSAPNQAVVDAIIAEWEALGEAKPNPRLLPLTGFAALTIDLITPQREAVIAELLEYGETDLLLYRDETSSPLFTQQQQAWEPWLRWAENKLGTSYVVATGIVPVVQPAENAAKYRNMLESLSSWQLACLATVVKPTTSLILGLAFLLRAMDASQLFYLSRLEESHNIAQWGEDEEATAKAASLQQDLEAAQKWRDLCDRGQ